MSRNHVTVTQFAIDDAVVVVDGLELSPTSPAKLSFTVAAKAVFFLVGPSGSGKTALLDLMSFQGLPFRGRIEVLGVDPARLAPGDRPSLRRRIGVVFQNLRLLDELDAFENLALAARAVERRPRDYADEIHELLNWVGLGTRRAVPVSSLSEDERRRLCVGRALVNRPDLLLVDEPTGRLSEKAAGTVLRLIAEANGAGTPVIFATRDGDLARSSGGVVYDMPVREFS